MSNKFNARKVVVDGITFDSKSEATRYGTLKLLERARQVRGVTCHPEFDLKVNGQMVGRYSPDFSYFENGRQIVDDVKGVITEAASLRMRLFQACHPDIELRIIDGQGRAKRYKTRRFAERRLAA